MNAIIVGNLRIASYDREGNIQKQLAVARSATGCREMLDDHPSFPLSLFSGPRKAMDWGDFTWYSMLASSSRPARNHIAVVGLKVLCQAQIFFSGGSVVQS